MRRLLIILALAAMAAGCQNSYNEGQIQLRRVSAGDTITIFTPAASTLTRTALQEESGSWNVYWEEGDHLGVFSASTFNADFGYSGTSGANASFQGMIAGTPSYAYYPYSAEAGNDPQAVALTLPASQTQGAPTGSPATRKPAMDYNVKVGLPDNGIFTFTQKLTLLHFVITPGSTLDGDLLQSVSLQATGKALAGDYTLDITAAGNAPVFGEGASEIVTLSFSDTPLLASATTVDGWMFINPDIATGDQLVFTVTTDNHIVTTLSATAAENFVRGALYEIALNIPALEAANKVSVTDAYDQVSELGCYDFTDPTHPVALHSYEEFEDQYNYGISSNNYVFTIQGLSNGKLTRITAPTSALNGNSPFTATLYTIYNPAGEVSSTGTWQVVKRVSGKYWLKECNGSRVLVILKEE